MTRRCTDCPLEVPFLEADAHFYRRKSGTFEGRCKGCSKRRGVEWIAANPERKQEYDRTRRQAIMEDPERVAVKRDSQRQWARANRRSRRRDAVPGQRVTPDERSALRFSGGPAGLVDVEPVRLAVEASSESLTILGRRAGYQNGEGLHHALLRPRIRADLAARILDAVGALPAEVGL